MAKIQPMGKQIDVMSLKTVGHSVVLGTAGSGKTTIAILRARFLAEAFPQQNILVVTFNKALIAYLNDTYDALPRNVEVIHYHRFARGFLKNTGRDMERCILNNNDLKYEIVEICIAEGKLKYGDNSTFRRPVEVFLDEIQFLERFGVETIQEYLATERFGRASAYISRENRKYFFFVYTQYIEKRKEYGYRYDWDDLALYTYKAMLEDTRPRRYSHVVVDEGQDFSPMMLKSLIEAVQPGGSFIFFGDVAQQIYGSRLSWRNAGIQINSNEIYRFSNNYRNSAEIVDFATDLMNSKFWEATEDLVRPSSTRANGPKPILAYFKEADAEIAWVVSTAVKLARSTNNVIIVRDRTQVNAFRKSCIAQGVNAQEIEGKMQFFTSANGISVTTFYSAKGMEFENVFIPFLCNNYFPDAEKLKSMSEGAMCAEEMKLLYVAVTRARHGLYMSYHGELTRLFPTNSENYNFAEI